MDNGSDVSPPWGSDSMAPATSAVKGSQKSQSSSSSSSSVSVNIFVSSVDGLGFSIANASSHGV